MAINLYNVNNHKPGKESGGGVSSKSPMPSGRQATPAVRGAFEKYNDPTGEVTGQGLKWGMWYVSHKVLLYKILVGVLTSVGAILWLFSLWQWGYYLIFGLKSDAETYRQLSVFRDYSAISGRYAAAPLQVLNVSLLPGGVNKYDAVAEVANPNERFVARFEYYFDFGSFKTVESRGFIFPGETRPIVYYGAGEGGLGNPSLVLEDVVWRRISNHEIADVKSWLAERLNFSVSDFSISRAGAGDGASAHIINFDFTNNSPFGYKDPLFYAELLDGDTPVAVLPLRIEKFKSVESRHVDLRSFLSSLSASDVRVYPVIDVFDKSVYMEPVKE